MQIPEPVTIWPTSVAGWLAIITSISALVALPVGWGKLIQKVNDFGRRVARIEKYSGELDTEMSDLRKLGERIMNSHEGLTRDVARAERAAETCNDRMAESMANVAGMVAEIRKDLNDHGRAMTERLTAVETELRLRRES